MAIDLDAVAEEDARHDQWNLHGPYAQYADYDQGLYDVNYFNNKRSKGNGQGGTERQTRVPLFLPRTTLA